MNKFKTKETYRKFISKEGTACVSASVDHWTNERTKKVSVDLSLTLSDGGDTAYVGVEFERGNKKDIKKARRELDTILEAVFMLDTHLRDAEDCLEEDKTPAPWEA